MQVRPRRESRSTTAPIASQLLSVTSLVGWLPSERFDLRPASASSAKSFTDRANIWSADVKCMSARMIVAWPAWRTRARFSVPQSSRVRRRLFASTTTRVAIRHRPRTDVQVTRQLREAARAIDIDLQDHVVVGTVSADPRGIGYYSFREAGVI